MSIKKYRYKDSEYFFPEAYVYERDGRWSWKVFAIVKLSGTVAQLGRSQDCGGAGQAFAGAQKFITELEVSE